MKIKLKSDVVSRKNDNGTIILMKMDDSDNFFKIEGVACEVWEKMVEENMDKEQVIDALVDSYEIDPDTIRKDVTNFLEDVTKKDLVETR